MGYVLYSVILGVILITGGIAVAKYMAYVLCDHHDPRNDKRNYYNFFKPIEKVIYRMAAIDAAQEMSWKSYAQSLLVFNGLGLIFLFFLQFLQGILPLNPVHLGAVRWDIALNTAISFVTNTNWQSYSGESTMSYLTQMLGLTVQNFLSAATGIVVLLAVCRGFVRKNAETIGNFWVDLTRAILYVLVPVSIVFSLFLVSQGVVQTINPPVIAETIEGTEQTISVGPAASQVAIKQLGSNGGGFFNANSAHPFENPSLTTNFFETFAVLWLPIACVFLFGYMVKDRKQGRAVFAAMAILFVIGLTVALLAEYQGNPSLERLGVGNGAGMEGKEMRFGTFHSVLWGTATTATSNGSVNSMHDSANPLTSLVYMFNMGIGEVIFGGVGVGFVSMIFYIFISMFIAGLMIGRTPEYLGKKLGPFEMIMATIATVGPMIALLVIAGIALMTHAGPAELKNVGSHGMSEILYAASSACGNNGSAFAGLNATTPFYNIILGIGMLVGRFATIIPALAVAGSLARKKSVPVTPATFPTTGLLFIIMVVGVIMIIGALTYFPFYSIGPVLEYFLMHH